MKKLFFQSLILFSLAQQAMPNKSLAESYLNDHSIKGKYSISNSSLVVLCEVWGLLKYTHPMVTSGQIDWDNQLIKILPEFSDLKNSDERNAFFLKWISSLGPINVAAGIDDTGKIKMRGDFGWIDKNSFPSSLKAIFNKLKNSQLNTNQQYLKLENLEGITFPTFKETDKLNMSYPSKEYRILAVFRYWNIVQYFYPYKNLFETPWESSLNGFLSEVQLATNDVGYLLAIKRMIASLKDSHAVTLSSTDFKVSGKWKMPLNIKIIHEKAIVAGIDTQAIKDKRLKKGMSISKINGKNIEYYITNLKPYVPASNEASLYREIGKAIVRTNDSVSHLDFEGNGVSSISVKNVIYRNGMPDLSLSSYQRDSSIVHLPGKILYLNTGNIRRDQMRQIVQEAQSSKGLIIDNRQYPKNNTSGDLMANFLFTTKRSVAIFSSVTANSLGKFLLSKPMMVGTTNQDAYRGKVAILINEETQSTTEFLTMAYRLFPGSIVVGSKTAGADGNVAEMFPLPGVIYTTITALGTYYPDGSDVQRKGIVPTVTVNQTINGILTNRDEQLEKAMILLN